MLKMAVTAPIAMARIRMTAVDSQPPRRTFLTADVMSAVKVIRIILVLTVRLKPDPTSRTL
jgi:hypothetical protein